MKNFCRRFAPSIYSVYTNYSTGKKSLQINFDLVNYFPYICTNRRQLQKYAVVLCKTINVIEKLFHKNKGYLFTKDIGNKRNLYYQLNKMIDEGLVVQMKRGLYKYPEIAELNHWQEVSLIFPKAVIYLFSAFSYYNLSNYIPPITHLAIDRNRKIVTNEYIPVKLHYIDRKNFKKHQTTENGIRIYSLERTVCDAIKNENQIGTDIMTEVAKSYYKSEKCNLNLLNITAKEINIEPKLRQIMQMIVNI